MSPVNTLKSKASSIKERNYTKKWGEIDIIAIKEDKLYFIEVKSVSCELEGLNAEGESVTHVTTHGVPHQYTQIQT
jgi:Holliday junction resolvase-like predicted endonuclease